MIYSLNENYIIKVWWHENSYGFIENNLFVFVDWQKTIVKEWISDWMLNDYNNDDHSKEVVNVYC